MEIDPVRRYKSARRYRPRGHRKRSRPRTVRGLSYSRVKIDIFNFNRAAAVAAGKKEPERTERERPGMLSRTRAERESASETAIRFFRYGKHRGTMVRRAIAAKLRDDGTPRIMLFRCYDKAGQLIFRSERGFLKGLEKAGRTGRVHVESRTRGPRVHWQT